MIRCEQAKRRMQVADRSFHTLESLNTIFEGGLYDTGAHSAILFPDDGNCYFTKKGYPANAAAEPLLKGNMRSSSGNRIECAVDKDFETVRGFADNTGRMVFVSGKSRL